jgi:UDP-4-amino-4,6-dideoxy-N-acetyl-beta-L-altrosamine N-acetyltransferase
VLRDAVESDVDSIRLWRNHPQVRRASIFTGEITEEGHRAWWVRMSANPASRVLIFEWRGRPAGVVMFLDHDPVARTAEWGFFLDVDGLSEERQLLPAWMELERDAVAYGFGELKLAAMGGRTLAWNAPVLALHKRFGFREVPERRYTTEIDGVDQQVLWTELRDPA